MYVKYYLKFEKFYLWKINLGENLTFVFKYLRMFMRGMYRLVSDYKLLNYHRARFFFFHYTKELSNTGSYSNKEKTILKNDEVYATVKIY